MYIPLTISDKSRVVLSHSTDCRETPEYSTLASSYYGVCLRCIHKHVLVNHIKQPFFSPVIWGFDKKTVAVLQEMQCGNFTPQGGEQ